VATRMSISGPSGYVLEPLREGADVTLYRGRQHGNPSPVLAVSLAAEGPSPHGLRRLEHEYLLAGELDSAWAAIPLALTRHEGRTILVLKDSVVCPYHLTSFPVSTAFGKHSPRLSPTSRGQ
jgi:hypothetical protein